MSGKSIDEVWPDRPPVCAGCGKEVDPAHSYLCPEFKLYCGLCAPRRKKEVKEEAEKQAALQG